MTKRLTSLVLALCLALGALLTPAYAAAGAPRGGAGISTTLRVEGYGFTAVEPTAITLPDTYKSLPEYGLTAWADKDPGFYTPLHVLAQYCVDNGLDPADVIDATPGFLQDFLDTNADAPTDVYFMYMVNDAYPAKDGTGYLIDGCPLANGDEVTLYDLWYSAYAGSLYTYFAGDSLTANTGEPVSVTLMGTAGMNAAAASPVKGATILASKDGGAEAEVGTTDENGVASLTFDEAGRYTLSAVRKSSWYDSKGNPAIDISRPYAELTVTEVTYTDAEAVAKAKGELDLGDLSAVKGDLTLPTAGSAGTSIAWQSDNQAVLGDNGKLTRPTDGVDVTLTLTATISRGTASDTKVFSVTVKAVTADEVRAEIQAAVDGVSLSATNGLYVRETDWDSDYNDVPVDNVETTWQLQMDRTDISVEVVSSGNANISAAAGDENGKVTFTDEKVQGEVTFRFSKASVPGVFCEKTVLVTVPAHTKTTQEQIDGAAALFGGADRFALIGLDNADADHVVGPLKLQKTLSSYGVSGYSDVALKWASDNTAVIDPPSYGSSSVKVNRPAYGEPDATVKLTLTIDKDSYTSGSVTKRTVEIPLTVPAVTQQEHDAAQTAVDAALAGVTLDGFTEMSSLGLTEIDPQALEFDIQLKDVGDLIKAGMIADTPENRAMSYQWSTDSAAADGTNYLTASYLRCNVYRSVGAPDTQTNLKLTLTYQGVSATKTFPVTIKGITQAEVDAANAEMKAYEAALFDGIKGANESPDFITHNLGWDRANGHVSFYRMHREGDAFVYTLKNSSCPGNVGVELGSWSASPYGYIGTTTGGYGGSNLFELLKRPDFGEPDAQVTLSTPLKSLRYEKVKNADGTAAVPGITAQVALTIPAFTNEVAALSVEGLDIALQPGESSYTIPVDEAKDEVTLTLNVKDPAAVVTVNGKEVGAQAVSLAAETKGNPVRVTIPLTGEETPVVLAVTVQGQTNTLDLVLKRTPVPGPVQPALPSAWPMHQGDVGNNAVLPSLKPAGSSSLLWQQTCTAVDPLWGGGYAGSPILVDGKLALVRDNQVQLLNASTGEVEKAAALAAPNGYYAYLAYGEGKLFVPLGDGRVQVFSASTLESLFLTEGVSGMQALSTITYRDGVFYTGFTNGSSGSRLKGYFAAFSAADTDGRRSDEEVAPLWTYGVDGPGYYGAGATMVGDFIVFAGDDGVLVSADAKTGAVKGTLDLGGGVRSAIVQSGGALYCATKDGQLCRVTLSEGGVPILSAKAALPAGTNASPAVAEGKVFVAGGVFADGYLAVFDSATLAPVTQLALAAAGNTPTLTVDGEEVSAWFTQNANPGALYRATLKDGQLTLATVYTPQEGSQNYCLSNVVIDGASGVAYYGNDSGALFAVKALVAAGTEEPDPIPKPDPTPTPDPAPDPAPTPDGGEPDGGSPTTGEKGDGVVLLLAALAAGLGGLTLLPRRNRRTDSSPSSQ